MKEAFIQKRFTKDSSSLIVMINAILDEYSAQGFDLTLRQLYYQLISRDLLPESWIDPNTGSKNTQKNYKRVGDLVSNARLAGMIDWHMISDRGRVTVHQSHWENPGEIIQSAAYSFRIDKWADQPCYCEVMVEKQALEGVLLPVCRDLDIPFSSNKGYSSSTAMYYAGIRMEVQARKGKKVYMLYLGDHDPSGIDMTRDVDERLTLFAHNQHIVVRRLALNFPQIKKLNPPENPAKETDARFSQYMARYGASSWELDAIEPRTLAQIVTDAVKAIRNEALWIVAKAREDNMRAELLKYSERYLK